MTVLAVVGAAFVVAGIIVRKAPIAFAGSAILFIVATERW